MKKVPTFHRRLRRRLDFSQNFCKPRAFGARTPLLGAFGPQKWEYPPPPSRKKIWETTRKNRPEQGFHSGGHYVPFYIMIRKKILLLHRAYNMNILKSRENSVQSCELRDFEDATGPKVL